MAPMAMPCLVGPGGTACWCGPGGAWDDAIREALDACPASARAKAFLSELMFALKEPADLQPLAHHVGAVLRTLALKQALADGGPAAG